MTPRPLLLNKSGFELFFFFSQAELEKWGCVLGQMELKNSHLKAETLVLSLLLINNVVAKDVKEVKTLGTFCSCGQPGNKSHVDQ